jgi:PAS domain S-box-containing protein
MAKIKTRFSDFTVKSKLTLLIFIFIGSIVMMGFVASYLFKSTQTLTILVNGKRVFAELVDSGIGQFYKYELTGDPDELERAYRDLNHAYDIAYSFAKTDSIVQAMPNEEWIPYLFEIYKEAVNNDIDKVELMGKQVSFSSKYNVKKLKEIQDVSLSASLQAKRINTLIKSYHKNQSSEKWEKLQSEFLEIHRLTYVFAENIFSLNDYVTKMLLLTLGLTVFVLVAIVSFIAIKISNSISHPINKLTENFKKIANGNMKSSVKIGTKNEVGQLSKAFSEIQVGLYNVITYSKKVAQGDYSITLKPKSEDDELTPALNKMAARLEEIKIKNDKEAWIQNGISGLDDEMRGNYSIRELSQKIITYLSRFLEVEMGAVYIFDEVLGHLEFTGSIGLNTSHVKEKIEPGEGLVGKAALNDSLQIIHTKNKFHKIFSATGEIIPEKIYMLPMHYNNRIQAVIELAPVNTFSENKLEFLRLITDKISANIGASVARYRHKELLDKTIEQAEILKTQEEKLRIELNENIRIRENLSREKALLDSMLKTLPDYIYFKDIESKFLRVSESMVPLFDTKSSANILGKSDFDFHAPKDAKRYFDEEQEIIKKGEGFVDVIRQGRDQDGEELWTSVTKLPMYDDTGKCIGTFGISKDITAIKKLEIEVKNQNKQLHTKQNELEQTINELQKTQADLKWEKSLIDSLMNNLPDAVYFKDRENRFIMVSKSLAEWFNEENPKNLLRKTDFDYFTKEHAQSAFNTEQEIIRTKKPVIGIVEKDTLKDGRERYVSTTKMPLLNEKGEVTGTFGISRDITKIKQLEVDIRERNDKLQTQQEELKAKHEELRAQEEELRVANEEMKSQEEELRVANEELAEQTKILTESEKNLQAQQEKLHEMNKELKLASQYKSEFLANMSHELRTPLNSLLILSKLLGENKKGNLTEEQLKSINIIHKSGKDLHELINEILDLSKIEAGKMTYNFDEMNTEEIKSEILHGFKPVADNKGLTLEVKQSAEFPEVVFTDKQRLMQIIKNLLSNAFKFTTSGGVKVNMGTTPATVKLHNPDLKPQNTFFIAVEDSGVGIPQSKVDDIFEAFQQADGSISRKYGGTGLGLSISKQLTRVLGGEIHVESTEGKGSVFTVYLPLDSNLVGIGYKNLADEKAASEHNKKSKTQTDQVISEHEQISEDLPVFIEDDRNSAAQRLMVLIIHNEKEKAKKLIELCHKRNFNAVVASDIHNGIKLATAYSPEAIIISDGLRDSGDLKKFHKNKFTSTLPLHVVSRIEDTILDEIEELTTPGSENFKNISKNLTKNKLQEFKQILVVEDDPGTREAIHLLFENKDLVIHEAKTGQQAYEIIKAKPFDCIILDLGLPDFSGNELLRKLKADNVPIPNVIIHTARELSGKELRELQKFSDSIVIKGLKSDERLMDEVTLFLHQVANQAPKLQQVTQEITEDDTFKGKKVLLVDDDIRNVFAIAQILEEREIEVLEAENGAVAIDILKNNSDIDLVLMDIMMPVMDGYEAMKIIRSNPETENIPIITISAKAMKEDYQKAIDNGANDYISKPMDVQKLLSLLKIWLYK